MGEKEYLTRKKQLEADIERIENIVPEGRAAEEVHAGRIKRKKTSLLQLGKLEDYLQSDRVKQKFPEFSPDEHPPLLLTLLSLKHKYPLKLHKILKQHKKQPKG